ncbi:transcription repressor OFP7 [Macadamia integrifolia]|uniref:transcription repressor OFP7 n=1 Tax=Macadamia integrifolia TaxID=60698 RepID=UPI001C4EFC9E|nr:transcription repressor OFP7 [Macadamia integrifolia]
MAKRFKLRLFRLIPSFQNCRSKDPSVLPVDPHPIFFRLSPTTSTANSNKIDFPATPAALPVLDPPPPPLLPNPTPKPYHSSLKRHVSSAFISVGCGFGSKSGKHHLSDDDDNLDSTEYRWKQNDKWHVIARVQHDPPAPAPAPRRKIHNSSVSSGTDADVSPSPISVTDTDSKNKRRKKKKKCKQPRIRISTSSGDSGWFSSEGGEDDGEETETLVSSSRSISTDLETINESPTKNGSRPKKKKNHRRVRRPKRYSSRNEKTCSSPGTDSPARLSVFQRLIPCTVDGKVRESFAVIKRSEDPYEDFKRSMLEMIVEKQMFEERELEQLLHCFLSLNSRQHHGVIVEAFSEIWEAFFCKSPRTQLALETP